MIHLKGFFALALLLTLAACAAPTPPDGLPGPETVWRSFLASRAEDQSAPAFNLTASVNYTGPERSSRMLLNFYGNFAYPVRLDVSAGMGTPLGFWTEDVHGFQAYYPGDGAAYHHPDGRLGAAALGFSTPFTMQQLAFILAGRYDEVVPGRFEDVRRVQGGYQYQIPSGFGVETLTLDPQGRPLRLTGFAAPGQPPWTIELKDFAESDPYRPTRLDLTRPPAELAVLRIKKLEILAAPWPDDRLTPALPPGTRYYRLD